VKRNRPPTTINYQLPITNYQLPETVIMYKLLQPTLLLIVVGLLTACANVPIQTVAPKVSLVDFRLLNLGLTEQNYLLRLSLKNPNPFPLPLSGMNYQLHINDKEFARGKNNQAITIPAAGEEFLDIQVTSNLKQIADGWQDWQALLKRQFKYRISGGVNVMQGAAFQIPFEYQGEVPLLWGK